MFKSTALLIVAGTCLIAGTGTANAHDRIHHADGPAHGYRIAVYRESAMPRSLSRDRGFRHWYLRSPLRHNRYLAWWQLHEIYGWEIRFHRHHHHPSWYAQRHRHFDAYRSYWRAHEVRESKRRKSSRRKRH